MLSAFAICETMNFLASASALPLSPSSFQQHSIQRLNLLKTSGCKPTNFLLLRYLCKLTFSWGELRGEDANKRNVVCLTPLQKKLQFSSQDEKYVGWTFWRWGGANLRTSFLWGTCATESRKKSIFHVFSKCWLMLPSVQKKEIITDLLELVYLPSFTARPACPGPRFPYPEGQFSWSFFAFGRWPISKHSF